MNRIIDQGEIDARECRRRRWPQLRTIGLPQNARQIRSPVVEPLEKKRKAPPFPRRSS